jgi:hypothetical protein
MGKSFLAGWFKKHYGAMISFVGACKTVDKAAAIEAAIHDGGTLFFLKNHID